MGLFSGIGKALKSVAKVAAPAIGNYFGGPTGQAIGSVISGVMGDMDAHSAFEASQQGIAAANAATLQSVREQMAFQHSENTRQMNFQDRMRSSQYQTSVSDLMAAGLNPMLAYGGAPAGVPSGSTASGASAVIRDEVGPSINSSMAMRRLNAELDSIAASAEASRATANNQNAQAAVQAVMIPKIQADTETSIASASNLTQQTKNAAYQYNVLMSEFDKNLASADLSRSQAAQIKAALPYISDLNAAELQQRLASFGLTRAQIDSVKQDIYIASLSVKRLENLEGAQHSWYMENISPYLPDVLQSSNSAASIKRSFR